MGKINCSDDMLFEKKISEEEFSQLTTGERPAMYDVPEPEEEVDEYKVGNNPSPFAVPASDEIPEA